MRSNANTDLTRAELVNDFLLEKTIQLSGLEEVLLMTCLGVSNICLFCLKQYHSSILIINKELSFFLNILFLSSIIQYFFHDCCHFFDD